MFPLGRYMVAGLIIAALGIGGLIAAPFTTPEADMRIEPQTMNVITGESFSVSIIVESSTPVNVFKGLFTFNPEILQVESITYNTELAELWAEEPWYSNGAGTLSFIGGSIIPGGFIGSDELITITFFAKAEGEGMVSMKDARILRHDGLGTDAALAEPIDNIFIVSEEITEPQIVYEKDSTNVAISISDTTPSTDLNNDGQQTITDTSIFMQHLLTQNLRSDFNRDGKVNTTDLSIILNQ